MKEGWELKKLGEVADILNGGTPKTKVEEFWNGNINWITPKDLGKLESIYVSETPRRITELGLQKSSAKLFKENSIILSTRAPIGHLAINKAPMSTNQGCRGIVPYHDLEVHYLFYYLKLNVKLLNDLGTGTTFKELSTKALGSVQIPIPPIEEQQQIVAILDDAFAAIEQAQANIEKNIENAKELFQSKLNDIFSQKGEGWEEKVWDDVLEIRSGRNQKQVLNSEGKYPILGSAGKVMGYADDFICEEYTTIVGRKGTINNPMLIKEKFWNVDTAFGLHAKDGLNKLYLFYFCRSFDFEKMDRGSGRPSLVKSDLLKIKMPVPSLENQQKIIKQLETLHDEITSAQELYKKKLTNLEDLKKSLLEQAFAGKLTCNEPNPTH